MPFGIYNTDKKAPGRATEVLIGRNNERASFIRRLLNSGKGGAYLITGQRGTGKTSFVEHCMNMYEQDTVQRFVNSSLAKSWPDKIMSLFFVAVLLVFPVFVATFLHFSDPSTIVRLLIVSPLLLLTLVGLYYSFQPCKTTFYEEIVVIVRIWHYKESR